MAKAVSNNNEEKRKKLRRIEIKTRKLSSQIFSGSYHSAFKGRGISFSEVREYQYGDDIRAIDWNVTARNRKPFIKVFEEERELTVMLLIDVSQSSFFGTQNEFKNHIIAEISGVIAFSAITNNDKVGVLFFSDVVEKFIPPKKGKSHILRIISEVYDFEPQRNGTNIAEALKYFSNLVKKKSIVFLLSDFMDKNFEDALNIVGRKHDLLGVKVFDLRERELPDLGLTLIHDAETGVNEWKDFSNKKQRLNYTKQFDENVAQLKKLFGKSASPFCIHDTRQDYVPMLTRLINERITKK